MYRSLGKALLLCALLNPLPSLASDYLDFGLYWFKMQGSSDVSTRGVTHDGTVLNVSSSYYDPSKPTLIHFHGWQPGSAQNNYARPDFHWDYANQNTLQAWKAQGWNVAIYYWNQFADEAEVKDAEAKMWSANGPRGMRYRQSDGSYRTSQAPNQSVGELAYAHITAALANNTSYDIRLTGHSLGNQLAMFVAKQIADGIAAGTVGQHLMPNRVELLDPFWSKDGKSYLGDENGDGNLDWNGERVRWYASELINTQNVAITWHKSSGILDLWIGDANTALEGIAAFIHNRFWYRSSSDIEGKHNDIDDWYFWSMASAPPEEVTINWWGKRTATGADAASASTSTQRIRQMMGNQYHWDQVEGRYTTDPADDQFEIKNY